MSKTPEIALNMPTQTATGEYRVGIVDGKTHKVKYMSPWRHNLILNSGLSHVATHYWIRCLAYCFAGQGSDPNAYDSGTDTASSDASGNVTSVGATIDFTTFSNGDCILWDDGNQGRILSRPSANTCTISTEYASPSGIPSGNFTVLKTSRTKLTDPLVPACGRCSSYLPNPPNSQVTYVHNATDSIATSRVTYDFPVVPAGPSITYNEIGLSPHNAVGTGPWTTANMPVLFSRIVIPGGLTLDAGDYLRVVYQLSIRIFPTDEQTTAMPFDNDGTPEVWTGKSKLYNFGLSVVNTTNATVGDYISTVYSTYDTYSNEPSAGNVPGDRYTLWVSIYGGVHSGVFPNFGQATVRDDGYNNGPQLVNTTTRNLYEGGLTYSHEKYGVWSIGQLNSSPIASFGIGYSDVVSGQTQYPNVRCGIMNIWDVAHTKLNTQTLLLSIKYSWSRTLTVD